MNIEDSVKLLEWLQNIFPRQYPAKMSDARRDDLLDLLEDSFGGYQLEEVIAAYKAIIKTYDNGAPEIAMVRNRLQTMLVEEHNQVKARSLRVDYLEGLPEDHPWRGCYSHHEAYVAMMRDIADKKTNGASFSDYVKKYPALMWRPWANPALDRNLWPYITADNFGGWTTDKDGFCVPYTKKEV